MPAIWSGGVGPREDDLKNGATQNDVEARIPFSRSDLEYALGRACIRSVPARVEKIDGKWVAVKIATQPNVVPISQEPRPRPSGFKPKQQTQGTPKQHFSKTGS